jgi:hypothetical protein
MADFRIREKNTNGGPLEFNAALGALHDPRRAVRLPAVHPGGRHAILVSLSLSHSRCRRLVGRSPWTAAAILSLFPHMPEPLHRIDMFYLALGGAAALRVQSAPRRYAGSLLVCAGLLLSIHACLSRGAVSHRHV